MAKRPMPDLMNELVEEILLRIPPDDPARLARAAVACKEWCRLVCGPGFRRRFRERHRSPPVLGILENLTIMGDGRIARFIPTCSFVPPRPDRRDWRALESRDGRVLLLHSPPGKTFIVGDALAVWDPVTDEQWMLPSLPRLPSLYSWKAAVHCAATTGHCDHLDCSRGPFIVGVVGAHSEGIGAYLYSSQANAWSKPITAPRQGCFSDRTRGARAGNTLYSVFRTDPSVKTIVEYNLGTGEMSFIGTPPM